MHAVVSSGNVVMQGLEGHTIRVGTDVGQVYACGQRVDGHWWVQVRLHGDPELAAVLKMTLSVQARDAIDALAWWLPAPRPRERTRHRG